MIEKVRRGVRTLRDDGTGSFANAIVRHARHQRQELPKVLASKRRTLTYRVRFGEGAPEPYRLIDVDPCDVEYLLAPRFQRFRSDWGTHAVPGAWDRRRGAAELTYATEFEDGDPDPQLVHFDDYTFYRSLDRHFEGGVAWEDTAIYRWFTDADHGDVRYDTEAGVRERLAYLDDLYESMKRDGYMAQSELAGRRRWWSRAPPEYYEVMVNVCRDGEIVFDDGRHRFCIARLLGLDSVPVRVFVRHPAWLRVRAAVARSEDVSDRLPELDVDGHPDLQDVTGSD